MKKAIRLTLRTLSDILLGICLLWLLGLCIYQPVALLIVVPAAVACYLLRKRLTLRAQLWCPIPLGIIVYLCLGGPQNVTWQKPWSKAPEFQIDGDTLTIRNLRDFRYRTEDDYDVRYRTETYDLNLLTGADFAECHWDGMEAICHTMMSFNFSDGKHLVVSAETRLPENVEQNAVGGLYKQYGLLYIFGTEEDLYALRTNYRHEDLTLLPLRMTPAQARELLLTFIELAQDCEQNERCYNTVTNNCSTGIMSVFREAAPKMPARYNLLPLHNGSISRVLYEHGALVTHPGESYEALRKRCYLEYDIARGEPEKYSDAIRRKIASPNQQEQ